MNLMKSFDKLANIKQSPVRDQILDAMNEHSLDFSDATVFVSTMMIIEKLDRIEKLLREDRS